MPEVSRYRGVSWRKDKRRWEASIKVAYHKYYQTEEAAALVYNTWALKLVGETARLNSM